MSSAARRSAACVSVLALLLTGCSAARIAPTAPARPVVAPVLSHGGALGEVGANSVVVWGRCNTAAELHIIVTEPRTGAKLITSGPVEAKSDFTGRGRIDNLAPSTPYEVRLWCSASGSNVDGENDHWDGHFRTAPAAQVATSVRFVWGGDIGGQNVCRDARQGYPIFDQIGDQRPDFFVALGDMVYADDPCLAVGRYGNEQIVGPPAATSLDGFRAVWRYNRDEAHLQRLLRSVPMYGVLDDHEVKNDAGPLHDTVPAAPIVHLLPIGVVSFLEYQPIVAPAHDPQRLYRSARWGKHLEVFFLDTRQYREANFAPDGASGASKTMLGTQQLAWLMDGLAHSDATWKVVVSSVPLSIPTGSAEGGRDGWANFDQNTGFEGEMWRIVDAMRNARPRNFVWITTDVHFGSAFRYQPLPQQDPSFVFHELITGPLNAGIFPKKEFDDSLHPQRLFFFAPPSDSALSSYAEAQRWFSFGAIDIDNAGVLRTKIINGRGETVFKLKLDPERAASARRRLT